MNTNLKSTSIPQSRQTSADRDSAGRAKAPTIKVQTDIRAGWVPGQNVRNWIRGFRQSLPWYGDGAEIR